MAATSNSGWKQSGVSGRSGGSQLLSDLRAAKRDWSARLLVPDARRIRATALRQAVVASPSANVQAIGIGFKVAAGRRTDQLAVRFYVRLKLLDSDLSPNEMIPQTIAGLPTDVEEVGLVSPQVAGVNPRRRVRPVQPGCSVGFAETDPQNAMAGTLGAIVADADGYYVLSNNHVLADQNRLPFGAPIYEPGLLDGGDPGADQIAEMTAYVPLDTEQPNAVDCAIARLTDGNASAEVLRVGFPTGLGTAAIGMSVAKYGRTTGFTRGIVDSVDTDMQVAYDIGTLVFQGQISITSTDGRPFSSAGDSGALLLEPSTNQAFGLLFSGNDKVTFANHLSDVLDACEVSLVLSDD
jgi:hypothetical protein